MSNRSMTIVLERCKSEVKAEISRILQKCPIARPGRIHVFGFDRYTRLINSHNQSGIDKHIPRCFMFLWRWDEMIASRAWFMAEFEWDSWFK